MLLFSRLITSEGSSPSSLSSCSAWWSKIIPTGFCLLNIWPTSIIAMKVINYIHVLSNFHASCQPPDVLRGELWDRGVSDLFIFNSREMKTRWLVAWSPPRWPRWWNARQRWSGWIGEVWPRLSVLHAGTWPRGARTFAKKCRSSQPSLGGRRGWLPASLTDQRADPGECGPRCFKKKGIPHSAYISLYCISREGICSWDR